MGTICTFNINRDLVNGQNEALLLRRRSPRFTLNVPHINPLAYSLDVVRQVHHMFGTGI